VLQMLQLLNCLQSASGKKCGRDGKRSGGWHINLSFKSYVPRIILKRIIYVYFVILTNTNLDCTSMKEYNIC
jgi:hypothetical protein